MKKISKFLTAMLTMALLLSLFPAVAQAKPYTYTVTFYAGNQGTFTGTEGIEITKVKGSAATVTAPSGNGNKIEVKNLMPGDRVSFNAPENVISLNDSKYYVKGIRQSGTEIEKSSFEVEKDIDYVIAYGIKGNQVGYTVNYEDEAGNELSPSRTYYGNVGDKPVIAHTYVEGYTPEAYALTKTLSANEAENVFTFVYREGEVEIIETPGETITTIVTETVDGEGTGTGDGTAAGAGTGTDTGAGTTGDGTGADAGTGEGGTVVEGTETEGGDAEGTQDIPDEDVPQDIVDLDDEEAPLANVELDKEEVKKGFPLAAGIAVAVAAVAALAGLGIFLKRHRGRK